MFHFRHKLVSGDPSVEEVRRNNRTVASSADRAAA